MQKTLKNRCEWVGSDDIYLQYHDHVWGRAVIDGQELFAKLCLDGQQAGLSWITILKKQANYEKVFYNFEPDEIVKMTEKDVERLMLDKGIVRNRLKINSIIKNAKAYINMREQGIDFSDFIWSFVGYKTIINKWKTQAESPTTSAESDAMAKALKKAGFSFVGSTICYAFMQAVGLIVDHTVDCIAYQASCADART